MDPETRVELDELSFAFLRQEARLTAIQLTVAEALHLDGEQLEAFVDRYMVHYDLQIRALDERLRARHPHLKKRLLRAD